MYVSILKFKIRLLTLLKISVECVFQSSISKFVFFGLKKTCKVVCRHVPRWKHARLGGNNWSNPTTPDLGLSDDGVTSPLSLGFNLSFPGGNTSQVRMCSNGYVWINGSSTGADYTPSSSELTSESPRLAPFWMDCDPTSGGSCPFPTASGGARHGRVAHLDAIGPRAGGADAP